MDRLTEYLVKKGVLRDKRVIKAFAENPRYKFVPEEYREYWYVDEPLPTFEGQTISQPSTVAFMTQALEVEEGMKVLEVGAGSGWQAAILSSLVGKRGKVYTIERIPKLYEFAKRNLKDKENVKVVLGDGSKGLPEEAPFDRIIVTAAAREVPKALVEQLDEEGILLVPVGVGIQKMMKVWKKGKREYLGEFVFVPLVEE
ncbi:MAG TPA: protein-L-isoaspartate(D-aspartate) O-methyltransferase [Candidatus Aenigmarchaeota archaeon]|nr:protein-L-isoaspartate(D-aspartate) O-methyltransferase [Candidatus Aenigmarchaeota archaeon]